MLREDLKDAKIADTDDSGRVIDSYALRHTFISNLAASGVHPKKTQELARHSTITLTMDCYTHTARGELSAALDILPDVTTIVAESARATGTNGAEPVPSRARVGADSVLPECLPESGAETCNSAQFGAGGEALSGVCETKKIAEKPGENRDSAPSTPMGVAGFEPARPFGQGILNPLRLPFRHTP